MLTIDTNGVQLGDTVRDNVTGLQGVVTGVHQYLTGCARITIQPPVQADGKVPDGYGQDVLVVAVVTAVAAGRAVIVDGHPRKGGPRADPHSRV